MFAVHTKRTRRLLSDMLFIDQGRRLSRADGNVAQRRCRDCVSPQAVGLGRDLAWHSSSRRVRRNSPRRTVTETLDPWFTNNLTCPVDRAPLEWDGKRLVGTCGHSYSVVDGIPMLLRSDVEQTHRSAARSLERAALQSEAAPVSDEFVGHRAAAAEGHVASTERKASASGVHPYVQHVLAATNGIMYRDVVPTTYPIPDIRLPNAEGEQWLLDIGCNWGRWCVASARKGYRVVGIDPSLEAVTVARDVAQQLGVRALFVAADARYLPFRDATFDVVFSFSVLQHFSKDNVRQALRSVRGVLKDDGVSLIQMLNRVGVRSLYNQARLSFKSPEPFDVRYWTTRELCDTFASAIGPSELAVDAFFSANAQTSDLPLLPPKYQLVVRSSEKLRKLANRWPALKHVADSIYITSSADRARLSRVSAHVAQTT